LSYVKKDAAEELKVGGKGAAVYDGILSDSMGVAPLGTGYLITPPWKPGTNPSTTFNASEWLSAQNKMLSAKKAGLGVDKELIINGLANGGNYFQAVSAGKAFGSNADISGMMAERIFREPHASITSRAPFEQWKKDVDMIADVQAKGKKGYWWSKCWTNKESSGRETCQDDTNYSTDIIKLRRFLMASYLMGAGDKSYFNFDTDICDGGPVTKDGKKTCPQSNAAEWFDDYANAMKLGKASGVYVQKPDTKLFTRQFAGGMVIVNPDTKDYELPVARTYYNLNGKKVTGKAIAPAGTGMIYLNKL
ncbi:MAG: putative glycoside hydrolase, partial [Candidatus Saccharimonadales bacterium]